MNTLYSANLINDADDSALIINANGQMVGDATGKQIIQALRQNSDILKIEDFNFNRSDVESFVKSNFSNNYWGFSFNETCDILRKAI